MKSWFTTSKKLLNLEIKKGRFLSRACIRVMCCSLFYEVRAWFPEWDFLTLLGISLVVKISTSLCIDWFDPLCVSCMWSLPRQLFHRSNNIVISNRKVHGTQFSFLTLVLLSLDFGHLQKSARRDKIVQKWRDQLYQNGEIIIQRWLLDTVIWQETRMWLLISIIPLYNHKSNIKGKVCM